MYIRFVLKSNLTLITFLYVTCSMLQCLPYVSEWYTVLCTLSSILSSAKEFMEFMEQSESYLDLFLSFILKEQCSLRILCH